MIEQIDFMDAKGKTIVDVQYSLDGDELLITFTNNEFAIVRSITDSYSEIVTDVARNPFDMAAYAISSLRISFGDDVVESLDRERREYMEKLSVEQEAQERALYENLKRKYG